MGRRLKGTGRVLVGLLRAFPTVASDWEFVALATPEGSTVLEDATVSAEIITVPVGSGTIWELHGFAHAAAASNADCALTLREIVGFGGPPTLLHIAEPPSWRTRQSGRPLKHQAKDRLLSSMLTGSIRRAAVVTAASPSTADWLQRHHGLNPPVIPPGIDPFFLEPGNQSSADGEYFLHAASGDPRDNTELVFRGFADSRLAERGMRLVVVGTSAQDVHDLGRLAMALSLHDAVELTGWVTDARLRDLYRNAIALVQPSNFEGFVGLQQLEALAQGTPLIVLNAPGVSDAVAAAAWVLPTPDANALARALRDATDLERRTELGLAGRTLVDGLTWERSAARFVDLLDRKTW